MLGRVSRLKGFRLYGLGQGSRQTLATPSSEPESAKPFPALSPNPKPSEAPGSRVVALGLPAAFDLQTFRSVRHGFRACNIKGWVADSARGGSWAQGLQDVRLGSCWFPEQKAAGSQVKHNHISAKPSKWNLHACL